MNVLYIHQHFNTKAGGTRSYVFSKHLVENGIGVTMITGKEPKNQNIDGINVLTTNTKYDQQMSFFKRVLSFVQFMFKSIKIGAYQKNVDVIYATSTPLTVGLVGLIVSKIKRKTLIFEVRDVWPDIPIKLGFIKNRAFIKILFYLEKQIYKRSKKIIALSPGMRDNLLNKGVAADKLEVITNLSDNLAFDNVKVDVEKIEGKYPALKDKFVCIHPGTMGYVNGLEHIMQVAEKYNDKDIVYFLIGEGKEKDNLIKIKEKKQLDNVVIEDRVTKEEIFELIKYSDAGLMTVNNYKILEDNSANKFFDFLAAGKPVILNYLGWQNDVLENAQAGKGFKHNDLGGFHSFIKMLKNDEVLKERMGNNAKNLAVQKYDATKQSNRLLNILNN